MTRRYYCHNLPPTGGAIELSDEEAQHAIRVMRVQAGDSILLFDGKGNECEAHVNHVTRRDCHCVALPPVYCSRDPDVALHLGIAFPKPDRCRELIERLTEIGVKVITPLIAHRTQRPPSDSLLSKLGRITIEACKQSGRNHLMEISPVSTAEHFFTGVANQNDARLIAHPMPADNQALKQDASSEFDWSAPIRSAVAAIGPEGGWTDDEIKCAVSSGFQTLSLGDRIYRIETAAVVIAGRLLY